MKPAIFTNPQLISEIEKHSRAKTFAGGDVIIRPGDEFVFIPIVISGSIRVVRENEDGKEVFLYHLYAGQTCALSFTCCRAGKRSMVKAVAEDTTEVLQIPVNQVEDWLKYPEWKDYLFNIYNTRFEELLQVIDLIAFSNKDKQLQHYLEERSKALNSKVLHITQQQIADELDMHREAVSRLLRTMEQKKMVKLGRNSIELLSA